MEFLMGNILNIVSIGVALVSLYIATNSLNHNKKTTIVIDKYEPILQEVKRNISVQLYHESKLEFKELSEIEGTYLFLALNKTLQKKIKKVLKEATIYNQFAKKVDAELKEIISDVFKDYYEKYLSESNSESHYYEYVGVSYFDSKTKQEARMFELFMNKQIFEHLDLNYIFAQYKLEKLDFIQKYIPEIDEMVDDTINSGNITKVINGIRNNLYDYDEYSTYAYRNDLSILLAENYNEIVNSLYFTDSYVQYYSAYTEIMKQLNDIEKILQEYLKEILIPNYKLKKFFWLN